MTRKEELRERYEDALFALLMDEFADAEGKRLEEENEALQHDPDAAVPEEVRRRCMRTIRRCFAARRARSAGRVAVKLLNRVAVVVMVGVMFFTVAFAASPKFRAGTLNLMINTFDEGTSFEFMTSGAAPGLPEGVLKITPEWIPDGFILKEHNINEFYDRQTYFRGQEELEISVLNGQYGGITVDTENAQVLEVDINGYNAQLIIKEEICLIYPVEEYSAFVTIYGYNGVTKDDIIKTAKNVIISQ